MFERDPYDKRLIKAIIIQLLGGENELLLGGLRQNEGKFHQKSALHPMGETEKELLGSTGDGLGRKA